MAEGVAMVDASSQRSILQLSHSQLEAWEKCRSSWHLRYNLRVPTAPSEALAGGNAFHLAAEYAGKEKQHGRIVPPASIIDAGMNALNESICGDTTGFLQRMRAGMEQKTRVGLAAFAREILPKIQPIAVEESFALLLEQVAIRAGSEDIAVSRMRPFQPDEPEPVARQWALTTRQRLVRGLHKGDATWDGSKYDARQVRFTGKIDVLTVTQTILDYKTGKPWDENAEEDKDQANAYLLAMPKARRVTFIIFPIIDDQCAPMIRPTTRTQTQIREYQRKVQSIGTLIEDAKRTGNFPVKTTALCGWCNVLGHCSVGQAWLKAQNRKPAVPMVK